MTKSKDSWATTENRLVLYLDIMGFKDLVQKVHPEKLHEHLVDVTQLTTQMKHMGYADLERAGVEDEDYPEVKSQIFSDSIVFVTEGTSVNDLFVLTKGAKWVSTILFQHHITFRGALAAGVMTYDDSNSIFFGQPLINAHQLETQLDLFGIVAHHTFEHLLKATFKKEKCKDSLQDFVPYPVKTKKGKAKHLLLDWIRFAENIHDKHFHEKIYSILSTQMSGGPKHYLDNTYSFFKECLDRPELKRDYNH